MMKILKIKELCTFKLFIVAEGVTFHDNSMNNFNASQYVIRTVREIEIFWPGRVS